MTVSNHLSHQTQAYLKTCGYSDKSIAKFTLETRLWHDLQVYGDIAESYLECLHNRFEVDLSAFEFEKYFPVEFLGKTRLSAVLISMVPFFSDYLRHRMEFAPLTLGMIEDAITHKKLI
jgi:Protein of unknown function (DUF1493)